MKPAVFYGRARQEIRSFPVAARHIAGEQIMRLQNGLAPHDSKPMRSIGQGVREIRINEANQYRVIYTAAYEEAIYVLGGFQKKSRKTPQTEIEKAKQRYADLLVYRKKL